MEQSQPLTANAALARLLSAERIIPDDFDPTVLAGLPSFWLEDLLVKLRAMLGDYRGVRDDGDEQTVLFERGEVPVRIALNGDGKICFLVFRSPRIAPAVMDLEAMAAELAGLGRATGLLVLVDGRERLSREPDRPLAVGSAFKLAVLRAVRDAVADGSRRWDEVVRLTEEDRTLPTGLLHRWPVGAPLTLHTLAALMITHSDNTATDTLIRLIGRERVEAVAPHNRPFLTTREFFVLRAPENRDLLDRYRDAGPEERRDILADAARRPLPAIDVAATPGPSAIVEWHFTARELCGLMADVADLSVFEIDPGPIDPTPWARVAFKGGSEPGVINLTIRADTVGGRSCVLALTINHDTPPDETRILLLCSAILSALNEEMPARPPANAGAAGNAP